MARRRRSVVGVDAVGVDAVGVTVVPLRAVALTLGAAVLLSWCVLAGRALCLFTQGCAWLVPWDVPRTQHVPSSHPLVPRREGDATHGRREPLLITDDERCATRP